MSLEKTNSELKKIGAPFLRKGFLFMNEEKKQLYKISKLEKEIGDLYVVIDTLQTNLRSAISELSEDKRVRIQSVQSCKWCMNWRAGDQKE